MSNPQWDQFIRRIPIKASMDKIYQAWATQEGLEKWFLRNALFIKPDALPRERNSPIEPGDRYEWSWYGYPQTMTETNQVLQSNGKDSLQFYFSGNSKVSILLLEEMEETICQLTQDMSGCAQQDRQSLFIECGLGWTFYLTNLKSILEGGLDLRNKNEAVRTVINA